MARLNMRSFAIQLMGVISCSLLLCAQTPEKKAASGGLSQDEVLRIAKEVQKQIGTLPLYGVFDDIHFGIKGRTVVLSGEASRPTLKYPPVTS